ncbi:hypothetical protein IWX90DRAFT_424938 [Phyllosticta citrichinensis]|uniref:Secreted protein n=1 Tax=Phyllosticta citrichinensis TaxID=1130410 RepID=A0ABR1Y427_9PEZI
MATHLISPLAVVYCILECMVLEVSSRVAPYGAQGRLFLRGMCLTVRLLCAKQYVLDGQEGSALDVNNCGGRREHGTDPSSLTDAS